MKIDNELVVLDKTGASILNTVFNDKLSNYVSKSGDNVNGTLNLNGNWLTNVSNVTFTPIDKNMVNSTDPPLIYYSKSSQCFCLTKGGDYSRVAVGKPVSFYHAVNKEFLDKTISEFGESLRSPESIIMPIERSEGSLIDIELPDNLKGKSIFMEFYYSGSDGSYISAQVSAIHYSESEPPDSYKIANNSGTYWLDRYMDTIHLFEIPYDVDSVKITEYIPISNTKTIIPSNKNLLDNWCFINPVNRNEKGIYDSPGYTIDKWILEDDSIDVSVNTNGINLKKTTNGLSTFIQRIDSNTFGKKDLFGKTVTLSVLTTDDLYFATDTLSQNVLDHHERFCVMNLGNNNFLEISLFWNLDNLQLARFTIGSDITLKAVKLEFGTEQTLAHVDPDTGEWVLNDPPDYDLQYSLCSLYNPNNGMWTGNLHSNENMLDNWYFADPINQRGKIDYTADDTYSIDRWRLFDYDSTLEVFVLEDDGGAMGIYFGNNSGNEVGQLFEHPGPVETYMTFSCLANVEGGYNGYFLYSCTFKLEENGTVFSELSTGFNFHAMQNWYNRFLIGITSDGTGRMAVLKAVKLEFGTEQTLAHVDPDTGEWVLNDPSPNKALELLKCQRYYEQSVWQAAYGVATSQHYIHNITSYFYKATKAFFPTIIVNENPTQPLRVYRSSTNELVQDAVLESPGAYNMGMYSPRIASPSGSFIVGEMYYIELGDNSYLISSDI